MRECECENIVHVDKPDSSPDGCFFPQERAVQTDYGIFFLCHDCVDQKHMVEYK
jgi:hypothetical protein